MTLLNNFFSVLGNSAAPFAAVATDYAASASISTDADFTGNADGKQGIISFWINPANVNSKFIFEPTIGFNFYLATNAGLLQVTGANGAAATVLDVRALTSFSNGVWQHILASWDMATGVAKLFFNGVDDTDLHTANNDTIKYTPATGWRIAGRSSPGMSGCISEFYFAPNQYLDLSNPANVAKFIAGGKPVYLGNDGGLPTGTPPLVYMRQNGANILVNSGTGGDFNNLNGTVGDCGSSPSD